MDAQTFEQQWQQAAHESAQYRDQQRRDRRVATLALMAATIFTVINDRVEALDIAEGLLDGAEERVAITPEVSR